MRLYLLNLVFLSLSSFALCQGSCKLFAKSERQFKLQIQVNYTAFYQGGVEQVEKEPVQFPFANADLIVVRWKGADVSPEKIQRVTSDENGLVEIKLEAGSYGIIGVDDKMTTGQYMPLTVHSGNDFESHSSVWEISTNGPIEISDETKVVLVNHRRSICCLCQ